MRRLFGAGLLELILGCAAVALAITAAPADPIVVLSSVHNLNFAEAACEYPIEALGPDGAAECRSVRDPRELGRRLENQIMDLFAVNARCQGVVIVIEGDEKYDGGLNAVATDLMVQKDHWDLLLDYIPGSKTYFWSIFPAAAFNNSKSEFGKGRGVWGEETAAQIAEQVCIVVKGQGASVP